MTPERWRQVTEVFHAALALDAPAHGAYLDRACAGDRLGGSGVKPKPGVPEPSEHRHDLRLEVPTN
jgi:hypothetical protein